MTKKIGILGGTFDPIHFGHLSLAISILEGKGLDEVWWIPVYLNPLKSEQPTASKHRLEMLKIALSELPQFKINPIEIEKEGPSYSVETLRELKKQHPNYDFHLILGDDTIERFKDWKNPEEIIQLAPPLIGTRLNLDVSDHDRFKKNRVKIPLIEISATEIRKRLKKGLYCGHLVPAKVLDYISHHRLYFSL